MEGLMQEEFESHPSTEDRELMQEEERTWGDRLVKGPLSPRHLKVAECAAQGMRPSEIIAVTGYSASRLSVILSNHLVRAEIVRVRERIYEDTIGKRLKSMADPALAEIDRCLNDKTNRYKENLKVETAKWLIEKLDGKAVQKHGLEDNLLASVMDRLDALKNSGRGMLDVTPQAQLSAPSDAEFVEIQSEKVKTEEDALQDWVKEFANATK